MSDSSKPNNGENADKTPEKPTFEKIEAVAINLGAPKNSSTTNGKSTDAGDNDYPGKYDDRPGKSIWFALLILVGMAIFVFLYEPTGPSKEEAAAIADAKANVDKQAAAAAAENSAPKKPILDAETVLRLRSAAEEIRQSLAEKQLILETQSVKRWAKEDHEKLLVAINKGQDAFNVREYAKAAELFELAVPLADALLAKAPTVLAEALAEGLRGIDDGNSAQAEKAYLLALAVEAGNTEGQKGLARSKTLDEVLTLLRNAKDKEADDVLAAARDDYRAALALDPDTKEAQVGLQRVEAEITSRAFGAQISLALAALDKGDLNAAEAAYKKAGSILPNTSEVKDGLADVKARRQAIAVAEHKRKSSAFEALELWTSAKSEYEKALAIDGSLEFAKTGLKRATSRERLDTDLNAFIAQPDSLFDKKVQDKADTALAFANGISPAGRKLREQTGKVQQLLQDARTPITVQLRSDDRTDVLFYRVGKLGSFTDKSLSIMPGNYTIIGRCAGFRDNRIQLALRPGQGSANVFISCTEKL